MHKTVSKSGRLEQQHFIHTKIPRQITIKNKKYKKEVEETDCHFTFAKVEIPPCL